MRAVVLRATSCTESLGCESGGLSRVTVGVRACMGVYARTLSRRDLTGGTSKQGNTVR